VEEGEGRREASKSKCGWQAESEDGRKGVKEAKERRRRRKEVSLSCTHRGGWYH
jgi:hypothetical protein